MILIVIAFIIFLVFLLYPKYTEPVIIKDVLTDEECEYIKKQAKPQLKASTIDKTMRLDKRVRSSKTAWLEGDNDPTIESIMLRCAQILNSPRENCECLQVVHYEPGGFYIPHQDASHEQDNMRKYTLLISLNDEYDGGETVFPNIDKQYTLKKGDALLFHTLNNYGFMDERAVHGGAPVLNGEKWICNVWARKRPHV